MGLADGRGIALKVEDGTPRARAVVMAAVLQHLGLDQREIDAPVPPPLYGGGVEVGAVQPPPLNALPRLRVATTARERGFTVQVCLQLQAPC